MRRIFVFFAATLMTICGMAQTEYPQFRDVNHSTNSSVRYKLYPTFNMWTFLKLDTRRGMVYQVQYSKNSGQSFETYVGTPDYMRNTNDTINGRYELYPTTNSWTFILIDQIDGDVYEVQWGQESKYRYVKKIE